MGNWYLVRHGETDWNKTGRTQGHVDVPLNATGRRQAQLLAKGLDGTEFAGIYSSDLARTLRERSTHHGRPQDLKPLQPIPTYASSPTARGRA